MRAIMPAAAFFRQRHRVVEDAVNAVADQHFVFHRFDMDIGRALHDGVPQERIDNAHDRQILGHLLHVIAREVLGILPVTA